MSLISFKIRGGKGTEGMYSPNFEKGKIYSQTLHMCDVNNIEMFDGDLVKYKPSREELEKIDKNHVYEDAYVVGRIYLKDGKWLSIGRCFVEHPFEYYIDPNITGRQFEVLIK